MAPAADRQRGSKWRLPRTGREKEADSEVGCLEAYKRVWEPTAARRSLKASFMQLIPAFHL